jgi:hypothetical protein
VSAQDNKSEKQSERVPLFGTWRNAYLTVIVVFVLDVAIFYLFERYFS